jgi:uncharacterized protein
MKAKEPPVSIWKTVSFSSLFVAATFSAAVSAQNPPADSPSFSGQSTFSVTSEADHTAKLQLIKQYLTATRAARNSEMGFNLVLDQMARGMRAGMMDRIQQDPKLTAEQKTEAQRKGLVYLNSHIQRLKQLTLQKIDLQKMVVDIYVPLYDKYFSQSDLQSLVNFYESPVGQKSLDVLPKLVEEGTKGINASIMPKMKEISAQMEAEDKAGKIGAPAANQ